MLDARVLFPESSLADLYDPDTMPPAFVKAHAALDSVVDKLYCTSPSGSGTQGSPRSAAFIDDAERTAFLFELYLQKTAGLLAGKTRRHGNQFLPNTANNSCCQLISPLVYALRLSFSSCPFSIRVMQSIVVCSFSS